MVVSKVSTLSLHNLCLLRRSGADGRHKEVLSQEGPLLLPPTDRRAAQIARVATRLVTALEEQDDHVLSGASWPPRDHSDTMAAIHDHESMFNRYSVHYQPSATAHSNFAPFRPASSNPLKGNNIDAGDWSIYLIDLVSCELNWSCGIPADTCSPSLTLLHYRARRSSSTPDLWTSCRPGTTR